MRRRRRLSSIAWVSAVLLSVTAPAWAGWPESASTPASGQPPAAPGQQATAPAQPPATPGQQPATPGQQPATPGQQAATAGQQAAEPTAHSEGVPIIYRGQEVGRVHRPFGPYSPEERVRTVVERLDWLVHDTSIRPEDLRVTHLESSSELSVGDRVIWVFTDEDAKALGRPRPEMAERALAAVQQLITRTREELSYPAMVRGVGTALGLTLFLGLLLWGVSRLSRALLLAIVSRTARLRAEEVGHLQAVGVHWLVAVAAFLVRLLRLVLVVVLIGGWLELTLAALPWTRPYARVMVPWVVGPLRQLGTGLVDYLPDFFSLLLVVAIAYGVLRAVGAFFGAVGRGTINLPDFPAEWADPTYKLARVVIMAMAFVAAFPYIPGSSAPAFQGVSLFLGFFITISSSSAIANVIAGIILTYTGAFRIGERVQIADTVGDVVKKSLFVTRVRTIKNVVVAIPNALVLGAQILNYSTMARGEGLILHTSVTIGYDAPWRQVHELLISAALATPGILSEPRPFILQTALNDFFVTYELNAYTREPARMPELYSDLHANIQDAFNEAGVEIMSPHATMLRDANKAAIPDAYLGEAHKPGAFRVRRVDEAD